jgi:hypothetical protein
MTESQRTALLTACAFAKGFLKAADAEARGGASLPRQEAQDELEAALRNLNPPAPDVAVVDWQHIDSDRHRGPSDWDRECQESRRLNR